MNARFAAPALASLLACGGETGQAHVQVPIAARGAGRAEIGVGEAVFRLSRAEIGVGPLYFCASESAATELCEVALAELLDTIRLDGLAGRSEGVGSLWATTGHVHSAFYDYGISWLLTESAAEVRPGAPGGHSAVLEGSVERGGTGLRFSAQIDVEPITRGGDTVNALATDFAIPARGAQLTLSVDPYRWLERIDLDALFALDDDGDGDIEITPQDQAYQAIVQGMMDGAPLSFEWRTE